MIVETGAGLPDAQSYASVVEADDYLRSRGDSAWLSADHGAREAALVRATDYMEIRWQGKFKGMRKTDTQALSWPRNAAPLVEMPPQLRRACILYAQIALTRDLAPVPKLDESGVATFVKEKQVGPIVKKFDIVGKGFGSIVEDWPSYPVPDSMMQPLLQAGAGSDGYDRVIR